MINEILPPLFQSTPLTPRVILVCTPVCSPEILLMLLPHAYFSACNTNQLYSRKGVKSLMHADICPKTMYNPLLTRVVSADTKNVLMIQNNKLRHFFNACFATILVAAEIFQISHNYLFWHVCRLFGKPRVADLVWNDTRIQLTVRYIFMIPRIMIEFDFAWCIHYPIDSTTLCYKLCRLCV